jgi:hypothetical protein
MKYRNFLFHPIQKCKLHFSSCNTSNGPAIQLSVSCSPQAVSSIMDLYRNEENISNTIQIVDVQKVIK